MLIITAHSLGGWFSVTLSECSRGAKSSTPANVVVGFIPILPVANTACHSMLCPPM